MDAIKEFIDLVLKIVGMGQTGWIATGIVSVLLIGGWMFLKIKYKRWKNKQAHKETQEGRNQDQKDIINENISISNDIEESEKEIEDILNDNSSS